MARARREREAGSGTELGVMSERRAVGEVEARRALATLTELEPVADGDAEVVEDVVEIVEVDGGLAVEVSGAPEGGGGAEVVEDGVEVVEVDFAVEVGVSEVGVFEEDIGGADGEPVEGGEAEGTGGCEAEVVTAGVSGGAGDSVGTVPGACTEARGDECADGGESLAAADDEVVVGEVEEACGTEGDVFGGEDDAGGVSSGAGGGEEDGAVEGDGLGFEGGGVVGGAGGDGDVVAVGEREHFDVGEADFLRTPLKRETLMRSLVSLMCGVLSGAASVTLSPAVVGSKMAVVPLLEMWSVYLSEVPATSL